MSQVARWSATAYLLLVPCLWWVGRSQDAVQVPAWILGTIWLVAVTPLSRVWAPKEAGWCLAAALATGLVQASDPFTLPLLALYGLIAWLSVQVLAQYPAEFLERRIVWLAAINGGYWLLQQTGYDPLFHGHPAGLFSRSNLLAVLVMAAYPLMARWGKVMAWAVVGWMGNLTALLGMLLTHAMKTTWRHRAILAALGIAATGWIVWQAPLKLVCRVEVWKTVFGQGLWSWFYGYGLGAFETVDPSNIGVWVYNAYLAAFHIGGALLLVPFLALLWRVHRDLAPSAAKTALYALAAAALVQTPWHFPRLIIVTAAIMAAAIQRSADARVG